MKSQLYDCCVYHSRTAPKRHKFSYRLFMFYIDLDEEQELEKCLKLVGSKSWAPYQLKKSDHYDRGKQSIKANLISYLETNGINSQSVGKIHLLTHLRTFGHIFNPVSIYFVDDVFGEPLCSIAEVGNTFNEQKLFLLNHSKDGRIKQSERKLFYVSPYSDLDTLFHFNLKAPKSQLRISINQSEEAEKKPFFRSILSGKSVPLTDRNLALYTLRFPLITLSILTAIHWQALLLWIKGHKVRRKASSQELQTDKHVYLKSHSHPIR